MTEAYPLHWPMGRPRAPKRERSRFDASMATARDGLFRELRLMGAKHVVLSTDLPLRCDGLPYATAKEPSDPGAAVYFEWKGRQMAFCCDRWDLVRDNVQAMRHTIGALRGLDRWGTGDMVEAAFTGFTALPAPGKRPWWEVLAIEGDASQDEIHAAYKARAKTRHPDYGGSVEAFQELQDAYERAKERAPT